MATKKKGISPNTDKRNISSQPHELKYTCSAFMKDGKHLTVPELKAIKKNLGHDMKIHDRRSREQIYLVLKGMGFKRVKANAVKK